MYKCQKCGLCCRVLPALLKWPLNDKGWCLHLKDDNTCNVYGIRPKECRVDAQKPAGEDFRSYYRRYARICKTMRRRYKC